MPCKLRNGVANTSKSWSCIGGIGRTGKIVASTSDRNGGVEENQSPKSFLSRSQTYALLKQQLEVAAKSEDYKEAARIRDSLKLFEEEEPVLRLRRLIKQAIAEERFEVHDFDAQKFFRICLTP